MRSSIGMLSSYDVRCEKLHRYNMNIIGLSFRCVYFVVFVPSLSWQTIVFHHMESENKLVNGIMWKQFYSVQDAPLGTRPSSRRGRLESPTGQRTRPRRAGSPHAARCGQSALCSLHLFNAKRAVFSLSVSFLYVLSWQIIFSRGLR